VSDKHSLRPGHGNPGRQPLREFLDKRTGGDDPGMFGRMFPHLPPNIVDGSFDARPLGITMIMGTALLAAIRLSRITSATPNCVQWLSLPPMPCSRYSTGYLRAAEYPGGV